MVDPEAFAPQAHGWSPLQRRGQVYDMLFDHVAPTAYLDAASPAAHEAQEDPSCVVCLERPRCVVVLPCRHLSMCEACAVALVACPMCRGAVSDTLVVFV